MPDVRVHLVIPYVGRVDHLREAVTSVLEQDDDRWLLTVVEDGDQRTGVGSWLETCAGRVEHVVHPEPLGLAANFDFCLGIARADLVAIVGCDDRLLPGYVGRALALTDAHPAAAVVHPAAEVIDAAGRRVRPAADRVKQLLAPPRGRDTELAGEAAVASLLRGNWTYFPALCWRRDVVARLGFRHDLATTLDLDLLVRVLMAGHALAVDGGAPVFQYRRHAASASSLAAGALDRFPEERLLFSEIAGACVARGWPRAARAARWHVTSRLHAATLLPDAVRMHDRARATALVAHLAGRTKAAAG